MGAAFRSLTRNSLDIKIGIAAFTLAKHQMDRPTNTAWVPLNRSNGAQSTNHSLFAFSPTLYKGGCLLPVITQ
jgi:hypothetical protein